MFKKLIHWLQSFRCAHKWEIYDEHIIAVITDTQLFLNMMPNIPAYHIKKVILRCSKCGDMKEKSFKM